MAKVKVPKRLGGVKVPKKVRKQAKRALKMVDTAAAREIAIAGLTIAAEALVDRSQLKPSTETAAKETLKQARGGRKQLKAQVKRSLEGLDLGEVLRAAAAEGARRFLESFEEADKKGREAAEPEPPKARRKANGKSAAATAE